MVSKAHVEYDLQMMGVRLALTRRGDGGPQQFIAWPRLEVRQIDEATAAESNQDAWLRLPEDDARAMYEALADYFGHAGHDTRALRKDYDAERGRVDKLITHLTRGA